MEPRKPIECDILRALLQQQDGNERCGLRINIQDVEQLPSTPRFGTSFGMTTLTIDKMTLPEKLSAMEQLWDNLCHQAKPMQSPEWHREILQVREEQAKYGTSKFSGWNEAKKRIQDRTS